MEYKLDRFLNQDIKKPHLGDQYFKGGRKKKTRRKPIRINPKMRGVFTKKAKKKRNECSTICELCNKKI